MPGANLLHADDARVRPVRFPSHVHNAVEANQALFGVLQGLSQSKHYQYRHQQSQEETNREVEGTIGSRIPDERKANTPPAGGGESVRKGRRSRINGDPNNQSSFKQQQQTTTGAGAKQQQQKGTGSENQEPSREIWMLCKYRRVMYYAARHAANECIKMTWRPFIILLGRSTVTALIE